jgi:hypothetical protein
MIENTLSDITSHRDPSDITLVSGHAIGADRMAEEYAHSRGWSVETHRITREDWERDGKRAGFLRNAKMVDLGADICVAFIRGNSKGATMCADLAEKRGIDVVRVLSDIHA